MEVFYMMPNTNFIIFVLLFLLTPNTPIDHTGINYTYWLHMLALFGNWQHAHNVNLTGTCKIDFNWSLQKSNVLKVREVAEIIYVSSQDKITRHDFQKNVRPRKQFLYFIKNDIHKQMGSIKLSLTMGGHAKCKLK